MAPGYRIVAARPEDVVAVPAIERAAAVMLRGHAPESVLAEATHEDELRCAQAAGRLWVALAGPSPVGFALVELLEPTAPHLEELDVDPSHGRRGLGTALVRAVCEWTARAGHPAITLTTFRAVPWNMPFYARLGFRELPPGSWTPALEAVVRDETARGLDPTARVVMRWLVPRD